VSEAFHSLFIQPDTLIYNPLPMIVRLLEMQVQLLLLLQIQLMLVQLLLLETTLVMLLLLLMEMILPGWTGSAYLTANFNNVCETAFATWPGYAPFTVDWNNPGTYSIDVGSTTLWCWKWSGNWGWECSWAGNERDEKFWLQLDAPYKRELVGASGLLLQWVVTWNNGLISLFPWTPTTWRINISISKNTYTYDVCIYTLPLYIVTINQYIGALLLRNTIEKRSYLLFIDQKTHCGFGAWLEPCCLLSSLL